MQAPAPPRICVNLKRRGRGRAGSSFRSDSETPSKGEEVICRRQTWVAVSIVWAAFAGASSATEIRLQNLDMKSPTAGEVHREKLLPGEVAGVEAEHVSLAGPISRAESLAKGFDTVFLFIKGRGSLRAGGEAHNIEPETIALPISLANIAIEVAEGDTLHYVRILKHLSAQDLQDMRKFSSRKRGGIYFKKFSDCEAYTEAIKSPKTVSRTVLPKDHVPRVAMGTVETMGPDEVGAHEHPMLDQLFLGLANNDIIVHADDAQVRLSAFSILHIPLGSRHWVEVEDGRRMYYMWMDFFLTKEGEEWLKTHKPVDGEQK
jgi:quercetin dioxygenase-like cupin family protein